MRSENKQTTSLYLFFIPLLIFHAIKLKYLWMLGKVGVMFCQNDLPTEEELGLYSYS